VIAGLSAARVIAIGVLAMAGIGWDLAERRVPNVLTVSGAVLGLAWAGLTQGWSGLAWSVAGCAVGLALFLPLFLVGGLGAGDVKLLAAFGAWLGWQMLLPVILFSAATGAVIGIALIVLRRHRRDVPLPFGPFIAAAGWLVMMWAPTLVAPWWSLGR